MMLNEWNEDVTTTTKVIRQISAGRVQGGGACSGVGLSPRSELFFSIPQLTRTST